MTISKDQRAADFQADVSLHLKRNKNLLDSLSKFEVSSARLSRAIIKSSTQCGCLVVLGRRQLEGDAQSFVSGRLCDGCREVVETEIGETLFYLTALCSTLEIDLFDVIAQERERLALLGQFCLH